MDENCDELMYREALLKELGDIRGLFKMPDDNDPLDPYWLDAMSDPLSVKAYVEAQLAALEAERDALRADANRLDFVMRNIAGASLRRIAGELADTGNLDAFRAAIDSKKASKEEA